MNIVFNKSLTYNQDMIFKKNLSNISNIKFKSSYAQLTETVLYNNDGNILDTIYGDIPSFWKQDQNISGYVIIGSSAQYIGTYAFSNNQLTSVIIPDSVKAIYGSAFLGNKLTSVNMPNVTTISANAFFNNQLTSVNIPKAIYLDGLNNNQITSINIPNTVKQIGGLYYNQLSSINIPDSVETILNNAFRNNQLTSVTIPDSIENIGRRAFANNPSLATVNSYVPLTTMSFWNDQFQGTASPLTIHVKPNDLSWVAGTGLNLLGNNNVTVIKDLI